MDGQISPCGGPAETVAGDRALGGGAGGSCWESRWRWSFSRVVVGVVERSKEMWVHWGTEDSRGVVL